MNQPPEHEVALAKALSRRRFLARLLRHFIHIGQEAEFVSSALIMLPLQPLPARRDSREP